MMRHALLALPALLAACGGSTSGPDAMEVQNFNAAAQGVATAAATYGTQAAAMTSQGTCVAAHDSYDAQVRPMVGQMQRMGPSMDAMMGSMHHADAGDMGCSADAMMAELDRHRTAACASATDMALDRAEARQHVATMTGWANHEMERSHDLDSMMGMGTGGMGGGGTTTGHCVHNADGSYTLQP